MSSESTTDARDGESERMGTAAAIETQLIAALEGAEDREIRYHLRQALQLVEALDDPE
ncbi:hypothetical protein [Haloplanus salilacus]|uniref:hypothetical protein n=1 Tax=Haloplanus salilacus TaxID=2949994 RepID=UPI0030CEE8E0